MAPGPGGRSISATSEGLLKPEKKDDLAKILQYHVMTWPVAVSPSSGNSSNRAWIIERARALRCAAPPSRRHGGVGWRTSSGRFHSARRSRRRSTCTSATARIVLTRSPMDKRQLAPLAALATCAALAACPSQQPAASPILPATPTADIATAPPAAPSADPAVEAKQLFATRCTPCHGANGAGGGRASAGLTPKPAAFSSPEWQAKVTDDHIEKIIAYGGMAVGEGAAMPPNADLDGKPVIPALRVLIRGMMAP